MSALPDLAAVCGNYCGTCDFYGSTCAGCLEQKGRMFWGTCRRYRCCVEAKQLEHCGWCEQLPCHWFDWNPEGFDEATFAANRQRDINNLLRRRQVGTAAWLVEQAKQK
jgi:hypothetical protein